LQAWRESLTLSGRMSEGWQHLITTADHPVQMSAERCYRGLFFRIARWMGNVAAEHRKPVRKVRICMTINRKPLTFLCFFDLLISNRPAAKESFPFDCLFRCESHALFFLFRFRAAHRVRNFRRLAAIVERMFA
jgi:hypothetical protein